nr:unnamed protein product [Callosobruchus chinensis]
MDLNWARKGISDLHHLSEKIKKHESSRDHINSCTTFALLGKLCIYRESIILHNNKVEKNRHILKRIISCVKFCSAFDLALRGHDESEFSENQGIFKELINFTAELDNTLKEHLRTATVFKGTSNTIQNEILESMLQVCREEICKQIEKADYLSIQCDKTTDVSNYCQMVLILRYFNEGSICEHFWGFIRIKDKTATGLKTCIENEIDPLVLKTPQKLIAQTYDGANVMSGVNNGVQAQIKIKYPNAHFIHCYAHQLNLIMQKSASQNAKVRVLPRAVITRWNYNIRTVNFVHENREKLIEVFEEIESRCEKSITSNEASGIRRALEDPEFIFWLELFHKILPQVDILYNQLQSKNKDTVQLQKDLIIFEKNKTSKTSKKDEKRRQHQRGKSTDINEKQQESGDLNVQKNFEVYHAANYVDPKLSESYCPNKIIEWKGSWTLPVFLPKSKSKLKHTSSDNFDRTTHLHDGDSNFLQTSKNKTMDQEPCTSMVSTLCTMALGKQFVVLLFIVGSLCGFSLVSLCIRQLFGNQLLDILLKPRPKEYRITKYFNYVGNQIVHIITTIFDKLGKVLVLPSHKTCRCGAGSASNRAEKIYLQREDGTIKKHEGQVMFPDDGLQFGRSVYKLYAVAQHEGAVSAGHYYAACLLDAARDDWVEFNDTTMTKITNRPLQTPLLMRTSAVGFFYIRQQILDDPLCIYRESIILHNNKVEKNRHILKRIISCVKFCSAFDLALRGHDESEFSENQGIFKELINFTAELDNTLKEHLRTATVFKGTSNTIQNEILESMLQVCREEICKQIEKADYLSIQCDETTDVSNYCQMVLILRYFNEGSICEHFWGFIRIKDKTATGLKTCIENEIDPLVLKTPQKLIAQTYDGANVMSGVNNGVQAQIKIKYPMLILSTAMPTN